MYVIRERMFRLTEDSDITNEAGEPILHVEGKLLSLRGRLFLRDLTGREVAQVHRKLAALTPTYEITIDGTNVAEVRKHLFSTLHDRFTIGTHDGSGMEMAGDLLRHEFTIRRGAHTAAIISKRWLALTDTYTVDVAQGENDVLILASVLALDLTMDQQRHAA